MYCPIINWSTKYNKRKATISFIFLVTACGSKASLYEDNVIIINSSSNNAKQQLQQALCSGMSNTSQTCTDNTPKTIKINGVIDFTNADGKSFKKGCVYSNNQCADTQGQEQILDVQYYCKGKSLFNINTNIAGQKPLLIGSNKTIIGIGKYSGIKGTGLLLRGVKNITIKNINITDINEQVIWGGDAITVDNSSNILIDHNYIARIGRQFVVTGWGSARNVVISNNNFDGKTGYGHYCDNRHYWNFLFLGANQTITLKQNWIHNTSGRAPELGQSNSVSGLGLVHILNNLYQSNYYMGVRTNNKVLAFVEANDFDNINSLKGNFKPIFKESDNDLIFAPYADNIAQANTYCNSKIGRSCVANIYSNYSPSDAFELNSNALSMKYDIEIKQFIGKAKPISVDSVKSFVLKNAGPQ
ncbi:pectate lyase family protein [Acinetobacter boissieri]|uniref:pectin lyase n=1 Tax=Acinetobacter boissieri TaxID=1219383 RepID=A0A1G6JSL8_9GAMM|nr:right-handed parallel beta-helix repeat-containing protein [Acinetobacter boissieri]SDC21425.1 pectin lyase [Acinetobacter boissieri]